MTRRVPLSRCRRCSHYRRSSCPLLDLEPCSYVDRDPAASETRLATAAFFIVLLAFVAFLAIMTNAQPFFIK